MRGKVVLVAEAAPGLGAGAAQRLAQEGARVVVASPSLADAEQTAVAIAAGGGEAAPVGSGILDSASARQLIAQAVEPYGGLDAVHVSAGVIGILAEDRASGTWDSSVGAHVGSLLMVANLAAPALAARGGGVILYASAVPPVADEARGEAYSSMKAGISALISTIALRSNQTGVRANAILAGLGAAGLTPAGHVYDGTPMALHAMPEQFRGTRPGEDGEVPGLIAYLVSDEGAAINGVLFNPATPP